MGNKRGTYKRKPIETRGKTQREPALYNAFWKQYTLDDVMHLSQEELDKLISDWLDDYAERQIRRVGHTWNYPEEAVRMKNIRKVKKESHKGPSFNKSINNKRLDKNKEFYI